MTHVNILVTQKTFFEETHSKDGMVPINAQEMACIFVALFQPEAQCAIYASNSPYVCMRRNLNPI